MVWDGDFFFAFISLMCRESPAVVPSTGGPVANKRSRKPGYGEV